MSGREHGHELPPHSAMSPVTPMQSHPSDDLEVVPGFERENLQGWIPDLATEADVRAVIEKAFDYRGDVSITKKDNWQLTGYLLDRRIGKTLNDSVVRLILASGMTMELALAPASTLTVGDSSVTVTLCCATCKAMEISARFIWPAES